MPVCLQAQLLWERDGIPSLKALVQHLEETGIPATFVARTAHTRHKIETSSLDAFNPRTHVIRLTRVLAPAYELQVSHFDLGNVVFTTRSAMVEADQTRECAESMEMLALRTDVEFAYIQRDDSVPPLLADVYLMKGPYRSGQTTILGPRLLKAIGDGSEAEGVRRVRALGAESVVSSPPALLLHLDHSECGRRFDSLGLFGTLDANGGVVAAANWERLRPPN